LTLLALLVGLAMNFLSADDPGKTLMTQDARQWSDCGAEKNLVAAEIRAAL
jgi:hypothetical protein